MTVSKLFQPYILHLRVRVNIPSNPARQTKLVSQPKGRNTMKDYITEITERLNKGCFKITPDLQVSEDKSTLICGCTTEEYALIFTKQDGEWIFQQKLTASDATANDWFGRSVSLSSDGTTVLICADGNSSYRGAAYIFTRSGTTWIQQAKLTASDGANSDLFGNSVSISSDGNTVLVGAVFADPSGKSDAGEAYIFTRSGSTWTQEAVLTASDGAAYDQFGTSVSISSDGNTAIVGASYADPNDIPAAGAAYIFTRSGSIWSQQAKLTASDAAAYDNFGNSVSISSDGNTVLVGALSADPNGKSDAGEAYIFTRSDATWTEEAMLTANDGAAYDQFGVSVSISSDGNTAIVDAVYAVPSGKTDAGAAYIFTRSGTTWSQQAKLTASDGAASDYFGTYVSISSDGTTSSDLHQLQ